MRPFDQRVELPNANLHLDRATWQDGSQIYLDSRGLLHLRSSDQEIPEATLVLANGATAGWTAGQGTWGNQYFTGNATNAGCRHVFAEVLGPFVERLR